MHWVVLSVVFPTAMAAAAACCRLGLVNHRRTYPFNSLRLVNVLMMAWMRKDYKLDVLFENPRNLVFVITCILICRD